MTGAGGGGGSSGGKTNGVGATYMIINGQTVIIETGDFESEDSELSGEDAALLTLVLTCIIIGIITMCLCIRAKCKAKVCCLNLIKCFKCCKCCKNRAKPKQI